MEYMNCVFDAGSIAQVQDELQRQRQARRDYIYPTSTLTVRDGLLCLGATKAFQVGDRFFTEWDAAEKAADESGEKIVPAGDVAPLPLNRTAASQLRSVLGIPAKFDDLLAEKGLGDLRDRNYCELLRATPRRFLVRTMAGQTGAPYVRAILSDRYRLLDNVDLFWAAAETFTEKLDGGGPRAMLWKARLTDNAFELFGVAPHIAGDVSLDRTFDPGDGWRSRWYGEERDVHNPAVRITNSETGQGGLHVEMSILRRVCENFCVWGDKVSTVHVGRAMPDEGLILSDETRAKESELTWLKIRDAIRTAFDVDRFQALIDRLNACTQQVVEKPEIAVDAVVAAYEIADSRKALILAEMLAAGDHSRFGLVQAVTATARRIEGDDADEAGRLEKIGGKLVEMPDREFAALLI